VRLISACPFLTHSHSLLISYQRTGSESDEVELGSYILFAETESLTAAALALLNDLKLRQFMEENAVRYMYQDHFTAFIENTADGTRQPSSLYNLSVALTDLGSMSRLP
jgi:hypothetical protein